jgi:hypothetical protein
MGVVKNENKNMKSIAYKSLVCPILEYGAACWDPYRECQINVLECVLNKAAKFVHHTGGLDWESLVQHRKIARMWALFKPYEEERVWKEIGDRLQVWCNNNIMEYTHSCEDQQKLLSQQTK